MFRRTDMMQAQPMVSIMLDGEPVDLPEVITLAAALLTLAAFPTRLNPVHERGGQKHRAPYCMMGVCFECLVTVDGQPNQQSCLIPVRSGMVVERQIGAADLKADERKRRDA